MGRKDTLAQRVRDFLAAHAAGGARILCACSGGADSIALLHLLRGLDGVGVVCAHFNHCLRGAESDRDEEFVRARCAEWGVPFIAGKGDAAAYAAERRLGIEEAARELRYAFLDEAARKNGCAYIATAHTADDNAETVLLNLIRGAGTRGLCGIPPVRGNVLRPLLTAKREEIEAYLDEYALEHVEDSSNGGDGYTRNRLRHGVMPLLRALNGAAVEHICSAAELLREDEEFFEAAAEEFLRRERRADGAIPVSGLLELPKPAAMRALRTVCGSPGRGHLEAVYALCRGDNGPRGSLDLPGGRAAREYDLLRFGAAGNAPPPVPIARREVRPGETLLLPETGQSIRCTELIFDGGKEIYSSFNTFFFQSEKICGRITVASRAPGDAVRLAGRNCTRPLRKLFSERGLTPEQRILTPVFSDGAGVIAVPGFGVAERCVPTAGAKALRIELQ